MNVNRRRHSKGDRRGGGLKIDWTKPLSSGGLGVLIAGSTPCVGLKGSEAVNFGDWGDRSLEFWLATTASTDNGSLLENVRGETDGSTAPVALPGQACAPQFENEFCLCRGRFSS